MTERSESRTIGIGIGVELSPDGAARRLAALLGGSGGEMVDPTGGDLVFGRELSIRPLGGPAEPPIDVWAVDGGQGLVADARYLQVYATRAARVRWWGGRSVVEDEGEVRVHLLGLGQDHRSLEAMAAPVAKDAAVDVNLLRDWGEWQAVATCVEEAERGGLVLVDGDLQPDRRIPRTWLAELFERAAARGLLVAGITKHSSLSWGGSPLLGRLEQEADLALGRRARWWSAVARTRDDLAAPVEVLVARLDPDARFSFRVDLPAGADPVAALAQLSSLSADAAFPGYPYPLSVADRLAACPRWLTADIWSRISDGLESRGIGPEALERAFADRHRLMERA